MVDSKETQNMYPNLNALNIPLNVQNFRLNKINEIKEYFFPEIKEKELLTEDLVNILLLLIN